ncbi:MAG: NYN domain-containing protein [Peptococcaceae bacterium]|nr:NYN domain-containing protein [Peptococcaceae bacterium]
MKEYLIVDGYNIIFSWPEFEKHRKTGMDHARARLVDILVNYAAISGDHVVVVFDAHMARNNVEHAETIGDSLEVIYTREGETADAAIERLAGELSASGRVHVATSDWAEQSMIFGRGAYRITPRELLDKVRRLQEKARARYVSTPPTESYLENRLVEEVRKAMEKWRREKT